MTLPIDKMLIDGALLDAKVANNLKPESSIVRSMVGAPTLQLVVHDPERELLETGILTRKHKKTRKALKGTPWDYRVGRARLVLDGRFYTMAGFDKRDSDIVISFEGWISNRLRNFFKPVTVERNDYTRVQFIKYRLIKVAAPSALVWAPSLSKKQKIDEPKPERVKRGVRVHTGLTAKGVAIDREQAKIINEALEVADEEKAPVRARLALIMAMIQESLIHNLKGGDRDSIGVLQLRVSYHGHAKASSVEKSVRGFLTDGYWGKGGAIELARKFPSMEPGAIAQNVQGSGHPTLYTPHREEAEAILDAYGSGTADDGGAYTEKVKRFRFRAGGRRNTPEEENYLEALERLIRDEVNWRAFEDDNIMFVASDFDFLKMYPVAMVGEDPTPRQRKAGVQAVGNIDFPYHQADELAQATFEASTDEWFAYPGAVVQVHDLGPMTGKHLMWELRQSVLSPRSEITLHRPSPPIKEPAPDKQRVSTQDVGAVPTSRGDLTYPVAKHGANLGGVAAHKARAWGNWQSDNAVDIGVPLGTRVFAVDNGTITGLGGSYDGTGLSNPNGFNVTLRTRNNRWFYTHLRSRKPLQIGDTVESGQLLGETGAANGAPHLHIGSERGDPERLLGV